MKINPSENIKNGSHPNCNNILLKYKPKTQIVPPTKPKMQPLFI